MQFGLCILQMTVDTYWLLYTLYSITLPIWSSAAIGPLQYRTVYLSSTANVLVGRHKAGNMEHLDQEKVKVCSGGIHSDLATAVRSE